MIIALFKRVYEYLPNVFFYLFLFVSIFTISSQNNVSIFNFSIFSGGKMNLAGALRKSNCQNLKFTVILKAEWLAQKIVY